MATLVHVRHDLENYLLTQEHARLFTPDSLQAQVDYHFKGNNARRATLNLAGLLALVVGGTGLIAWLIPREAHWAEAVITTFFALLHAGAAFLFVLAPSRY